MIVPHTFLLHALLPLPTDWLGHVRRPFLIPSARRTGRRWLLHGASLPGVARTLFLPIWVPAIPSACAGPAGCETSPYPRCNRAPRPLLRSSTPPGPAKPPRCETLPGPPAAQSALPPEFRADCAAGGPGSVSQRGG